VRLLKLFKIFTDLIFIKYVFRFVCVCVCVCVRLRARVYGQKNSASGETVLRALCIDIIRGALLGNALLHLSHSLWNSVVLNEINQS
jgi:hypothetical protein